MLISSATLLAFIGASVATYIAPGADMAYIAAEAIPRGLRYGFAAAAGILIGILLQALAVVFGVTAIFAASPAIFSIVKWLGVAYLVYLGLKVLRSGPASMGAGTARRTPWRIAALGVGVNLLNPKISLFFFAFLPQFVDVAKGRVLEQLLLLSSIFFAGAVISLGILVVLFSHLGGAIASSARAQRWQRWITGSVLIGYAGGLALSGLRR